MHIFTLFEKAQEILPEQGRQDPSWIISSNVGGRKTDSQDRIRRYRELWAPETDRGNVPRMKDSELPLTAARQSRGHADTGGFSGRGKECLGYDSRLSPLTHHVCLNFQEHRTSDPLLSSHVLDGPGKGGSERMLADGSGGAGLTVCSYLCLNESHWILQGASRGFSRKLVFLRGRGMKRERKASVCSFHKFRCKEMRTRLDHQTVRTLKVHASPHSVCLSTAPTVHDLISNSEGQNPTIKQVQSGNAFFHCTHVKSTAAYSWILLKANNGKSRSHF